MGSYQLNNDVSIKSMKLVSIVPLHIYMIMKERCVTVLSADEGAVERTGL